MAKARELYFRYPDNRDDENPGYEIPARGQLVIANTPEEIQNAIDIGYIPMTIIAHSPKSETGSSITAFGMTVEDNEIIPFPNRDMADRIAQMISPRQQKKSQS